MSKITVRPLLKTGCIEIIAHDVIFIVDGKVKKYFRQEPRLHLYFSGLNFLDFTSFYFYIYKGMQQLFYDVIIDMYNRTTKTRTAPFIFIYSAFVGFLTKNKCLHI